MPKGSRATRGFLRYARKDRQTKLYIDVVFFTLRVGGERSEPPASTLEFYNFSQTNIAKKSLKSISGYLESNLRLIPKICTNLTSKYVNNNIPIYTTISNLQVYKLYL